MSCSGVFVFLLVVQFYGAQGEMKTQMTGGGKGSGDIEFILLRVCVGNL